MTKIEYTETDWIDPKYPRDMRIKYITVPRKQSFIMNGVVKDSYRGSICMHVAEIKNEDCYKAKKNQALKSIKMRINDLESINDVESIKK